MVLNGLGGLKLQEMGEKLGRNILHRKKSGKREARWKAGDRGKVEGRNVSGRQEGGREHLSF